jgi:peptidyl-prolyl cis-trans isomerase C
MSETTSRAGCAIKPRNLPRPKEISVNGVVIDRSAISRETQNHPASKPVDAWTAAARSLVVRELLLQEARRLGLEAIPAQDEEGRRETTDEALIRALVEQQISTPTANDDECRRYYALNESRFRSADIYEVRHILFSADPKDLVARDAARTRAEAAIVTLAASPDQFSSLAEALSACPSGRTGGNLGQITRGQTVPEFEAALGRMLPGQLSDRPIETRYGYHVVWLDRRIDGVVLPFDTVRPRIAEWLDEKVRRTAIRQYISNLADSAVIAGMTFDPQISPASP